MPRGIYIRTEEINKKSSQSKIGKKRTPFSEEHKRKISLAKIGKKQSSESNRKRAKTLRGRITSEETRQKIGLKHKGKIVSVETRRKQSESHKGKPAINKGIPMSEVQKLKISIAKKGRNYNKMGAESHLWKGGVSFEIYGINWRESLKRQIRERDDYTCQYCKLKQTTKVFSVHHINFIKNDCDYWNLITLCAICHNLTTNGDRIYWTKYFQDIIITKKQSIGLMKWM